MAIYKGAASVKGKHSRPMPLLVGEDNPRSQDPRLALYPYPTGGAGGRLAKILGLTPTKYMQTFDAVNLCNGSWELDDACFMADMLEEEHGNDVLVLLGSKVCRAFHVEFKPFTVVKSEYKKLVILPHPSGRCRIWNDRKSRGLARKALREAGVKL